MRSKTTFALLAPFLLALAGLAVTACATLFFSHGGLVLYAQSLPSTKHTTWSPNAVGQNVTNYVVSVDGTPQNVSPAVCTATVCTAAIVLNAFGAHTVTVVAQNLALSTDPASVQGSPAASVSFSLNQAPATVSGTAVTN